ncbi:hypothetical protein ACJBU6_11549 [Exserohilum turcicum]
MSIQRRVRWGHTGCSSLTAMRATSTKNSRTTASYERSLPSVCLLIHRTYFSHLTLSAFRLLSRSTLNAYETWHATISGILIRSASFQPFKTPFFDVFTYDNCKKAFEAAGLVPIDAQRVIDRLDVRLHTPPQEAQLEIPWTSRTLSNSHEFGSQSKLVRDSFVRSPTTAQEGFSKLIKGAEEMLHENVLMKARVRELEEQLAEVAKRQGRKRKRIQTVVRCQRRHVVRVVKKRPYQVNGAVEPAGEQAITLVRAKKT